MMRLPVQDPRGTAAVGLAIAALSPVVALVALILFAPAASAQVGLRPRLSFGAFGTASTVTEISRLHLADIYLGRTTRFANGQPVMPIDLRSGSDGRVQFSEAFLGRSEAQMKAHWSKIIFTGRGRPPVEASSGEAVREIVAGNPRAIGYLDAGLVNSRLRAVRVN